jgi:predicted RNase H-like nuclease (RuvC/YqgF family)
MPETDSIGPAGQDLIRRQDEYIRLLKEQNAGLVRIQALQEGYAEHQSKYIQSLEARIAKLNEQLAAEHQRIRELALKCAGYVRPTKPGGIWLHGHFN